MAKNKTNKPIMIFIIMIILVLTLWILSLLLLKDNVNRGTFGDMFGAVNAIFSGLAFAGLIYTILLQKEELELQRNEISETRREFITQNNTLKSQRFENTFFNMLELHHKIVDGIDTNERKSISINNQQIIKLSGRDVFKNEYYKLISEFSYNKNENVQKTRNEIYLARYKTVQTDFGHYFRNVYRIIKLIDTTDFFPLENKDSEKDKLNQEERYKYTSILRAQLSDYETLWIFYNCLSSNGIEKFKPLIERYCMFKNIPANELFDPSEYSEFNESAFTKN